MTYVPRTVWVNGPPKPLNAFHIPSESTVLKHLKTSKRHSPKGRLPPITLPGSSKFPAPQWMK